MAEVKILLTFDDGPHTLDGIGNYTRKILRALEAGGIVAAFYVQTGVPYRMASKLGRKVVQEADEKKHVIDIHTAGKQDHQKHWETSNPLDQDLPKAVEAIKQLTGRRPKTVRAVGLELANPDAGSKAKAATEQRLRKIYTDAGLKHVGINVDSFDNTEAYWVDKSPIARRPKPAEVKTALEKGIKAALRDGEQDLILLFHDINKTTAAHLPDYIAQISASVEAAGHTPSFTKSRAQVEAFLDSTDVDRDESWNLDKRRPKKR